MGKQSLYSFNFPPGNFYVNGIVLLQVRAACAYYIAELNPPDHSVLEREANTGTCSQCLGMAGVLK